MPTAAKIEWPQGQPLFEVQWRAIAESLAGNGIVSPADLQVSTTTNSLEIEVSTGTAYYEASEFTLSTAETHTLTAGDGSQDRWDTVYFDTATQSTGVREGTPAASPEPPDIQGDELLLAIVYVPTGATDVGDGSVLNWRAQFSNEAESVHYNDSTGTYGIDSVEAALDELQEAAQISEFPVPLTDTDQDADGEDLVDNVAGATIWDASAGNVPRESVDDQKLTTTLTSSTYTTDDEEVILVDTTAIGAASTITLASADAEAGNTIAVTDLTGDAGTYPITIDTEGSETINGSASTTVASQNGGVTLISDGTNWSAVSNVFNGLLVEDGDQDAYPGMIGIEFGTALDVTDDGDDTVTVDAQVAGKTVLSNGTFSHTGGSATTHTITGVTTNQTENLNVEVGVDADPSFNAAYAFDYTWDYSWNETNQEMDVTIEATWATDPSSGNDVTLDYEIYTLDDVATYGVGVADDGTNILSPAWNLNFGSNINVSDDGDQTATISAPPPATPVAKLTTSDTSTNINQGVLFPWTASPITDGPFSYDGVNSPKIITINESGTYQVHLTIGISGGGVARDSPNAMLYKNRTSAGSGGTQLKAAGKSGYIRNNNGHDQSSLHLSWIGELSAGDSLAIQMRQEGDSGNRNAVSNETNMFVKKVNRP